MAVLRLITSSNLVGSITGRSPGFSPLRNSSGINASLAVCISNAGRVAHQTASSDGFAPVIDRGDVVSGCQRNNPFPLGVHERPSPDEHRLGAPLEHRIECDLDFALAVYIQDDELLPDDSSCGQQILFAPPRYRN